MTSPQPLISIIIPAYNAAGSLRRAVDSVIAQTYSNWELILIDDGSTDGTAALCDTLAASDPRIKAIHKPNGGEASARNAGLNNATGEFICQIDADDHVCPTLLEDYLGTEPADCSVCGIQMFWGSTFKILESGPDELTSAVLRRLCSLKLIIGRFYNLSVCQSVK